MVFDGALCWPRFDTFLDQGFILPNRTQANGDKFLGALVDLDCDAISDEAELRCKPYTQHPSVSRHIRNAPHMATLSQLVLSLSTRKARALETLALAYCFPFATERETLALLSRGRVSPTARGFWKISSVTLGKKWGLQKKKKRQTQSASLEEDVPLSLLSRPAARTVDRAFSDRAFTSTRLRPRRFNISSYAAHPLSKFESEFSNGRLHPLFRPETVAQSSRPAAWQQFRLRIPSQFETGLETRHGRGRHHSRV